MLLTIQHMFTNAAPICRHSGPQGSVKPFTVVRDPAAWYADDWKQDKSWIYELTDEVSINGGPRDGCYGKQALHMLSSYIERH